MGWRAGAARDGIGKKSKAENAEGGVHRFMPRILQTTFAALRPLISGPWRDVAQLTSSENVGRLSIDHSQAALFPSSRRYGQGLFSLLLIVSALPAN
ncbi:hypothetical protein SBA4_820009 [Candidatus Sulfopaludibacter sp. SbA4]|nr:hypothetical protein SBA4_820009 [Candidatus Sulfopaludibacter sp. SbA4]